MSLKKENFFAEYRSRSRGRGGRGGAPRPVWLEKGIIASKHPPPLLFFFLHRVFLPRVADSVQFFDRSRIRFLRPMQSGSIDKTIFLIEIKLIWLVKKLLHIPILRQQYLIGN